MGPVNGSLQVKSTEVNESNRIPFPNPFTHSIRVIFLLQEMKKQTLHWLMLEGWKLCLCNSCPEATRFWWMDLKNILQNLFHQSEPCRQKKWKCWGNRTKEMKTDLFWLVFIPLPSHGGFALNLTDIHILCHLNEPLPPYSRAATWPMARVLRCLGIEFPNSSRINW